MARGYWVVWGIARCCKFSYKKIEEKGKDPKNKREQIKRELRKTKAHECRHRQLKIAMYWEGAKGCNINKKHQNKCKDGKLSYIIVKIAELSILGVETSELVWGNIDVDWG